MRRESCIADLRLFLQKHCRKVSFCREIRLKRFLRPEGPRENSPGREQGGLITETSSPEGAAQNPCATWLLCRPFRALLFCRLTPGLRPGLISAAPSGLSNASKEEFRDRN